MTSFPRSLLLAATLLAAPLTVATAQDSNPTGNYGSNRSATSAPGTADSQSASKLRTGDVPSRAGTGGFMGSASKSTTPGGTGRAVVPGNNSTRASASPGTAETRSGGTGGGGK
jgi:hypothetical protein